MTNQTLSVTGSRYIIHFYCLAVKASFYSDVAECLPVDPATTVRFPAGGRQNIFALRHLAKQISKLDDLRGANLSGLSEQS